MKTKKFESGQKHFYIKFSIPEFGVCEVEKYRWYENLGRFVAALYTEYHKKFPGYKQKFFIQILTVAEILHLEDGRTEWKYIE